MAVCLFSYATNDSVKKKSLSKITALAADWGVHEISVFDAIPTGRMIQNEKIILTEESHLAICKEARQLNRLYNGRLRIVTQSWTNTRSGRAGLAKSDSDISGKNCSIMQEQRGGSIT